MTPGVLLCMFCEILSQLVRNVCVSISRIIKHIKTHISTTIVVRENILLYQKYDKRYLERQKKMFAKIYNPFSSYLKKIRTQFYLGFFFIIF